MKVKASLALLLVCTSCSTVPYETQPSAWDIESPRGHSDASIRTDFLANLAMNPNIDPFDVRVKVTNGKVTVRGKTDDAAHARIDWLGRHLPGVKSVDDQILPKSDTATTALNEDLSDEELARAVLDRLSSDTRIWVFAPGATCADGVLTMQGLAHDLRSKLAAADLAESFPGVSKVVNQIRLQRTFPKDDARLKREILTALRIEPAVTEQPELFAIDVSQGRAIISGPTVEPEEAQRIIERVGSIQGVLEIDSRLLRRGT